MLGLNWSTGENPSKPFEHRLRNSSLPSTFPQPRPRKQAEEETDFFKQQWDMSRPPTTPDPYAHKPSPAPYPFREQIFFLAPYLLRFSIFILRILTLPLWLPGFLGSVFRVAWVWTSNVQWAYLIAAAAVCWFLPGMSVESEIVEKEKVVEPLYVLAVANSRSMKGLLGAGSRGELMAF